MNLIVAIGKNGEIGKDGKLIWHIKEDLKYFKEKTLGNILIMGKVTYESIGKPLKGRTTIVLTRDKNFKEADNLYVARSVKDAVKLAKELQTNNEIFVAGGASVYKEFLDKELIDTLYITKIDKSFKADKYFPEFGKSKFKKELIKKAKYLDENEKEIDIYFYKYY